MKIVELKPGDKICSLEKHRKTLCPIFDIFTVVSVSDPHLGKLGEGYANLSDFTLVDEEGNRFDAVLESDKEGSIYDKIFFTPNIALIVQEVTISRNQADMVVNSIDKYKNIISECDFILGRITPIGENSIKEKSGIDELKMEIKEEFQIYFDKFDKIFETLALNKKEGESSPKHK